MLSTKKYSCQIKIKEQKGENKNEKTKKTTHAFYFQETCLEKITEWSTIQNMFFLNLRPYISLFFQKDRYFAPCLLLIILIDTCDLRARSEARQKN